MFKISRLVIATAIAFSTATATPMVAPQAFAAGLKGVASWYGPGFHGRTTANGERYDMHAMTAAHKTLKFGTKVKVTNNNNGKSVVVRINDRGPFIAGRVIDVSRGAADALGMVAAGAVPVSIQILG